MKSTVYFTWPLILAVLFLFFFTGCDNSTGNRFMENDYSMVPELADTSSAEKVELKEGLHYYVIEEGNSKAKVVNRDVISMFVTLRRSNGTILSSTYANNRTTPQSEQVDNYSTRGFELGVIGMREGGHRVIVVPPSLGFTGASDPEVRNDTVIYEVELVRILN